MSSSSSSILGKGTYGTVKKINGRAVKHFRRGSHLIQEFAAGYYLKDCPYIVDVLKADFRAKTMDMELYKGSLKNWLRFKRTTEQKMDMLKNILLGLVWLGDLGLVHGDLKPGNIVVNWDKAGNITKMAIADLGFVAPESYSKAERTAPIYREITVKRDFRHDIFSLGVICLECFGHINITHQTDHHELISHAKSRITNDQMRELTISMLSEDREDRPTARKLLSDLFGESPDIKYLTPTPLYDKRLSKQDEDYLEKKFKKAERGQNNIKIRVNRARLGYNACRYYLGEREISSRDHKTYAAAMISILSSIFGKSGFDPNVAAEMAGCDVSSIHGAILKLLTNQGVLAYLFYTDNGCSFSRNSSRSGSS